MTKLDKIKKEAIETHIPIMMDDTLDKITEIIGSRKLHRILEIGTATGYSMTMESLIQLKEMRRELLKQNLILN